MHSRSPAYADTAILREIGRIGRDEGPEELLLYDVTAFLELPDGRMVVADASGLRMYSRTGEFLAQLGRRGRGPGEVELVVGMAVKANGSLLAVDNGNRRINVYNLATGKLDHWPFPSPRPGYGRNSIVGSLDGETYVAYNPPLPQDGSPSRYPRPIFVKVGNEGEPTDTIFADTRFLEDCPTPSTRMWGGGFIEDLREWYFPKVKWALAKTEAAAVGCPASYEFDLIHPDGSVLRISRDWVPVQRSSEERELIVEGVTFSRNRTRSSGDWSWEGERPPEQKPAYDRIVFGREGRIWVWPTQPSIREEIPDHLRRPGLRPVDFKVPLSGAFDVFDASGEFLGSVRLPADVHYRPFPGIEDPLIRGDTLWAITYDSLDVPYLTQFAVQWPGSEPD